MCRHEECLNDHRHDPEKCTIEQIRECHGDTGTHPCNCECDCE
ncbi:MAG: hypothetical protein ACXQTY_07220 [Candidatus Methanogasteraceae archaeon]